MLQYEEKNSKISNLEVDYWKKFVRSNLKIGVEIETNINDGTNNYDIIRELNNFFDSTRSTSDFGSAGVHSIKLDGSLYNGMELVTVGRRVDFINMYSQYKYIIDKLLDYEVYLNGRCGLHNHILIDYNYNYTSLEKNMPGIIVKNFMQLIRKHIPELVYITSTVHDREQPNIITRANYYSSINNLLQYTPKGKSLYQYVDNMNNGSRYHFVNFSHFDARNDYAKVFHLELRFPDGSLFPAQIAAQGVLYTAMLLKAIELSEGGLINTGTSEEWNETKLLAREIRNDGGSNRTSIAPSDMSMNRISERALNMIKMFKPQIDSIDKHAYAVLFSLATNPVSKMLREFNSEEQNTVYKEINKIFHKTIQNMYNFDKSKYERITELINLVEVNNCVSEKQWIYKVAEKESMNYEDVAKLISELKRYRNLRFDAILGSVCFE